MTARWKSEKLKEDPDYVKRCNAKTKNRKELAKIVKLAGALTRRLDESRHVGTCPDRL